MVMERWARFLQLRTSGFARFLEGPVGGAVRVALGCVGRGQLFTGGGDFVRLCRAQSAQQATGKDAMHTPVPVSAERYADLGAYLLTLDC
jgi:hypothetical protein